MTGGNGRALVLAAHGSRRESSANALVRRMAEAIRARRLYDEVAVAFHQGEPGLDTVLDELDSNEVTVVPILTSRGHYAEVVLPAALSRNRRYPELRLRQTPPVGTHPGIAPLVARRVGSLLREHRLDRHSVSLALVGHGTPRHGQSRDTTLALAETLRRRRVAGEVLAAFLDDDPPVDDLLERARYRHVVVVPFLIGGGEHVSEDIPRLLRLSQESGVRSQESGARNRVPAGSLPRLPTPDSRPVPIVDQAIGTYPGLIDIIIDLARRHAPPPGPKFRPRGARPPRRRPGTVHLVGAGPGDPGLITARGLELLRQADVVVHDRLIGPELLSEPRASALLIDAGKGPGHAAYTQEQINALLLDHARLGRTVVRLKGGDPFVFGRGSEEVEVCRAAGVEVHVVPGVSSAIAAPAAAGIPVTARGIARSFAVLTGHTADEGCEQSSRAANGRVAIPQADTLIILMGRANLAALAADLIASGRDSSTPAACIQAATTPEQRVTRATLATIADEVARDGLVSPMVTVVGEVARWAHEESWSPSVSSAAEVSA